jgi:hypothetical protein
MAQQRQRRRSDLERIRRLFTPDDAEFQRLVLVARLAEEWRHF